VFVVLKFLWSSGEFLKIAIILMKDIDFKLSIRK